VATKKGDETFVVGADTKIREGRTALQAHDLMGLAGYTVRVSYEKRGDSLVATRIIIHRT
jgi:hypothetical protein